MSLLGLVEQEAKEKGLLQGRIEGKHLAIEVALDLRFPDSLVELMQEVYRIKDLYRLHILLQVAKKADLADIKASIAKPLGSYRFWPVDQPLRYRVNGMERREEIVRRCHRCGKLEWKRDRS